MVRPRPRTLIVPPALAGERLDRAMAALAGDVSRGEARRLIAAGVVFVAGRRTKIASRAMRSGEGIAWEQPARLPEQDPLTGDGDGPRPVIVIERPDLWMVDKPAGMPVEATRAGSAFTLAAWLAANHGPPFVTHRLDAATSGLLVVARDGATQAGLNRLFAAHAIGRRYLAMVSPPPAWVRQTFRDPLDGRVAVTHARVLARSPLAALLLVDLETGRARQIRRHLAAAGFPVVGETAAGARTRGRLLLHACELTVPWPAAGGRVAATVMPPRDFREAASALQVELPPALPPRLVS